MLRKLGIGFIALATMAPGLAAALGVGEYELNSYLNEPLHMTVELHDLGGLSEDEILANLATQEAFDAAGVDRGYFLNDLKFDVEVSGNTGVLHIRSKQPVREPYLNFLVEFLWPTGRLMREYTVLLDPPSYADSDDSVQPAVSQPTPRPAARPQTSPEPAPRRPEARPAQPQTRPTAADRDVADDVVDNDAADSDAAERRNVAGRETPADTDGVAPADQDATTYRVRPSDTMWRIAQQQRPTPDVSVQQMMLAIQENNPDAFINENVNLVREGAVLRIPSANQVRRFSSRDALSRVASQNREWRGMRPEPAARRPQRAPLDATGRTDDDQVVGGGGQGQVTLVTPDSRDGVQDGDATGGPGGNADTAALQNELAIRDENLDRLNRENNELRSRLDALDDQVGTSQQLLEMRSEKIAALQAELRRLREEQDVDVDPSLLESSPLDPSLGDESQQLDTAAADTQAGGTGDGGADAGGDDQPLAVAPPAKPEPATLDQDGSDQATAEPEADDGILGLIRDNLLYVGAALAVLLLLLLLAVRRRQSEAADEYDSGDDDGDDDDRIGDDFSAPIIAGAGADGDEDEADLEEDLADDQMDPMERADVYVAYGQYPQAVDFLRNEINQDPERGDLKIRLLELLHESNDERGFEQQATLFAGTSPAVDAAIKRLGGDPGEHDYGNTYAASPESADPGDELSLDDLELDLASDLSDQPDDSDNYSGAALTGAAAGFAADREQSDPQQSDDGLELDDFEFTLDEDEPEQRDRDETSLELDDLMLDDGDLETPDEAPGEKDDGLEFSLEDDLDSDIDTAFTTDELAALDDAETPRSEQNDRADDEELGEFDDLELGELDELDELEISLTDEPAGVETPSDEPRSDLDDQLADLSLDLDDDEPRLEKSETPDEPELSLDDLSLDDLDLDEGVADDATTEDATIDDEDPLADLDPDDLDDPNLDLDDDQEDVPATSDGSTPDPAVPASPSESQTASADEAGDDMLGDDDDFDFLGETDENATKLDLARAYIDMGDAEGARDILNEVLSEGSDEQQGEAKELLARVS